MKVPNGDVSDGEEVAPSTDPPSPSSSPLAPHPTSRTTSDTTNQESAPPSQLAPPSSPSAPAPPSLSSPNTNPDPASRPTTDTNHPGHHLTIDTDTNHPRHHLTIDTNDTGSLLSNDDAESSIIPTSARLSLATTSQSLPASDVLPPPPSNGDAQVSVQQMIDTVLAHPGWNIAAAAAEPATGRARGDSLFSIGRNSLQPSLVPTLPPYEMHTQHREVREVHVSFDGAGVGAGEGASGLRGLLGRGGGRVGEEKRGGHDGDDDHNRRERQMEGRNGDGGGADASGDDAAPPFHAVEQETANEMSAHYSRIVRTIDEGYTSELDRLRQELSAQQDRHVEEVALMRNNVDSAYREVLKARDEQVEKAKREATTRVFELEKEVLASKADSAHQIAETHDQIAKEKEAMLEEHAKNVERERNAVEDVWERRWRDRMSLLDEEASRRVRERDQLWLRFLERNHPNVLDEAKDALFPVDDEGTG